jgi:hypothetical protein
LAHTLISRAERIVFTYLTCIVRALTVVTQLGKGFAEADGINIAQDAGWLGLKIINRSSFLFLQPSLQNLNLNLQNCSILF